jgi:7-cyano-7-deazaguanine synthase
MEKTLTNKNAKAVILLSGGLDSTTTLAIAQSTGFTAHAMTFRYGQRHSVELDAAKRIAEKMRVAKHIVVDIDLAMFGGSALTSAGLAVPKDRSLAEMDASIPITYVPARNTIFLSFALAWAEVLGAADIFLGVNTVDYSGYPDCRPEYIAAYEQMASLATKAGVEGSQLKIHTPLITLTKAQIIRRGLDLGVDYSLTTTCYDPDPTTSRPCGRCDACQLRIKGFQENGMEDPALARY